MTTTEYAANTARAFLAAEIAMASVNCEAPIVTRTQAEQLLRLGVRQGADTLVCTREDGSRVRPNALTIDFWRLAKRLGLNIHYHSLRHGHATC